MLVRSCGGRRRRGKTPRGLGRDGVEIIRRSGSVVVDVAVIVIPDHKNPEIQITGESLSVLVAKHPHHSHILLDW